MDKFSLRIPTRADLTSASRNAIQPVNALPNIIAGLLVAALVNVLTGAIATAVFAMVNALWDSARTEPQQPHQQ